MTTLNPTSAAVILLSALNIFPANVTAQVTVHPGALKNAPAAQATRLPQLGGGKYSAEMLVHVPVFGDGVGEMIVQNNLMRYHASFQGGAIWETDWINFNTGASIEKKHFVFDMKPIEHDSFVAKLSNIEAVRMPDTTYRGLPVKAYRVDHKKVTDARAFDGIVYIYADTVAILIKGKERRIDDFPKCKGTYEDLVMDVVRLHMDQDQNLDALNPPPVKVKLPKPPETPGATCTP